MKSADHYPIYKNEIVKLNLEDYTSSNNMNYQNSTHDNQIKINQFQQLPNNIGYVDFSKQNGNVNRFPTVMVPNNNDPLKCIDNNGYSPTVPQQLYYHTDSTFSGNIPNGTLLNKQNTNNSQYSVPPLNYLPSQLSSNFSMPVFPHDVNSQMSTNRSNSQMHLTHYKEPFMTYQLSNSFSNLSLMGTTPTTQFNFNGPMHLSNESHQSAIPIQDNSNLINATNLTSSSQSLPHSCLTSDTSTRQNLQSIPSKVSISTPVVVPNNPDSNRSLLIPSNTRQGHSLSANNTNNLSPSRRMINVMEERLLIPPGGIMNPVPNIIHISKKPNCSPNIMRSTLNAVPCNEDILSKIRLPLAILIHPFRDLVDLQVIRSKQIIRCRNISCRGYLNPFVGFPDQRHWKCNLCHWVNEFSDESLGDIASAFGIEPQRRAEVRLSTVEYIAPKEYSSSKTVRMPVYVFMFDLNAHGKGNCGLFPSTLNRILTTIDELLERFPGYNNARFSLIGFCNNIHFYPLLGRCRELVLSDITQPIELPTNIGLVVSILEFREQIRELLTSLPDSIEDSGPTVSTGKSSVTTQNCLGSALLVAKQLIDNCGGRITIFNASRPSIGEGVLRIRESMEECQTTVPIFPEREFYKSFSLECCQAHIGVDLFQLGTKPCDLASLSIVSRYCGGSLFNYPDLTIGRVRKTKESIGEDDRNVIEIQRLLYDLNRYLTRKIGFDAVLRVRHSPGFSIHSCYGNMYKRTCDMFSMPTINPDSGLALRLDIADGLLDTRVVFVQAALLYTSSIGERRIRVHTLCLPVSSEIDVVFRMADHQALAGFLAKSVSDRVQSDGRVLDAREALVHAVVDPSRAFGEFCLSSSQRLTSLPFPYHLRLLPLFIWGILQSEALSPTNHRPDSVVAVLDRWRNAPLSALLVDIYPSLFDITSLACLTGHRQDEVHCAPESTDPSQSNSSSEDLASNVDCVGQSRFSSEDSEDSSWDSDAAPGSNIGCFHSERYPRPIEASLPNESDNDGFNDGSWYPEQLHLTSHSLTRSRTYLMESSRGLIMLLGVDTPQAIFHDVFGVDSLSELPEHGSIDLPELNNAASIQLRLFIRELQISRPIGSHLFVITKWSSHLNTLFQQLLVEDDKPDSSYHRFLKHIQRQVNK